MMKRRANSDDSIPMDLIPEILSRLPAKSVARFRCVSKPWRSIICRQDFTKLFHTVSSSNPRLIIGVEGLYDWSFFSSPQPQNHYGKSSLVLTAEFQAKFSGGCNFSYASGLLYFEDDDAVRVICNPSTGQYAILPPDDLRTRDTSPCGHLVFDPIGKQFKVMVLNEICNNGLVYHILTLGTEKEKWREIKSPSMCSPDSTSICINGVFYYYNYFGCVRDYYQICCFDVRSEKFKFLHVDPDVGRCFPKLLNYKGNLCGCNLEYGHNGGFPLKLRMWILENVEEGEWSTYANAAGNGNTLVEMPYDLKGEWSTYIYTLSVENALVEVHYDLFVVGITASGEIVLEKPKVQNTPFYVFYFNPVTNTVLSVEIQGVGEVERYHSVCFVDHVEDLDIDVMMTTTYATTSIPRNQGFNNEKTSANSVTYLDEPKIPKGRDVVEMQKTNVQNIVELDEVKLVKGIEEIKMKVDALERLIVKEKRSGFLQPSLCVGALIGVVIGYCLRLEVLVLYGVLLVLLYFVLKSMSSL